MNDIAPSELANVDDRMLARVEMFTRSLRQQGSLRPDQRNILMDMVARIIYQPGS